MRYLVAIVLTAACLTHTAHAQWPTATPRPRGTPITFRLGPLSPLSAEDWTIVTGDKSVTIEAVIVNHTDIAIAEPELWCSDADGSGDVFAAFTPDPLLPGERAMATATVRVTDPLGYACVVRGRLGGKSVVLPTVEPTNTPTYTPTNIPTNAPTNAPTNTVAPTWTMPVPTPAPLWLTWFPVTR